MNGLIRFSLNNPRAITVMVLTIVLMGAVGVMVVPADILPVYRSPAVQVLTFYSGMSATNVEKDITSRMERWTGQTAGLKSQESRSIIGASVIRNYYNDDVDPAGALTAVNSLSTAAIPNLPPGTLPPVVLAYDPTATTPVCIVALDSKTQTESTLYDTGRYQVRNMIMASPGANAPVVYGGRLRTILALLDPNKLQARNLAPVDVMDALDRYNIFMPAGSARIGDIEYALDSNSMYEMVERMGDIPVKVDPDTQKTIFLRDVAMPEDGSLMQTTIVRVDGRRQVYVPVYRQQGSSTLTVVDSLRENLPNMKSRLTTPDVDLKMVMDQSVYVRNAIKSLAQEGIMGALLCSLVILLFLGQWRMTMIAVLTVPISVLGAIYGLYMTGQTVNVMTLVGLALAIGPLIDTSIVCLENVHRHMSLGASPRDASLIGVREVALPAFVSSLCTLLVLLPMAMMPGVGKFLFKPMFISVAFAMSIAFVMAVTFVPSRCAKWLRPHTDHDPSHGQPQEGGSPATKKRKGLFAQWQALLDRIFAGYGSLLNIAMKAPLVTVLASFAALALVVLTVGAQLRREFYPEVDAGSFQIAMRAKSGTRLEVTETIVANVEQFVKKQIAEDLDIIISEIGLTADWSAAFTNNSGSMDASLKIQLTGERSHSAQEYAAQLREGFAANDDFNDLEFSFDTGGMIRSAMNEGKSTPINVRITSKSLESADAIANNMLEKVKPIDGVVDARVNLRLDYPQYTIEIDRDKASQLGLAQMDVMRNMVAAFNSSVQFNKHNFWIDPKSHNQYYVGVQYPEGDISDLNTLMDIPIATADGSVPLRTFAELKPGNVPNEIVHTDLQPTVELTMGVHGRDLGRVAADVSKVVAKFGVQNPDGTWVPFDPDGDGKKTLEGSTITLSGEYQKMLSTFRNEGYGIAAAVVIIYFMMVALFRSYVTPAVVLMAVPVGCIGVIFVLYFTKTALSVQSLLGVTFMIGTIVSNTVLLTDFAQNLRMEEDLSPTEAVRRAASIRVRPIVMTALSTFFALLPMSLGIERGSEANAPLGRAVLGGLVAGAFTTLFVVPCLYSLLVRGPSRDPDYQPDYEPQYDPASSNA